MIKEVPPLEELNIKLSSYIIRMWINVERAIDEVTKVISVRTRPERPRHGIIYYLEEDISDIITQGYWVWFKDDSLPDGGYWESFVVGSQYNELEARVAALEGT